MDSKIVTEWLEMVLQSANADFLFLLHWVSVSFVCGDFRGYIQLHVFAGYGTLFEPFLHGNHTGFYVLFYACK